MMKKTGIISQFTSKNKNINSYIIKRLFSVTSTMSSPRPTTPRSAITTNRSSNSSSPINSPSNPQLSFPCLDKLEKRSKSLVDNGPEPSYSLITKDNVEIYKSHEPLFLDYGGYLPSYQIAYETWGTLNEDRSNAILVHTGLSASSHAKSTVKNPKRGWWEDFIGPGKYVDTNKYFVICTNVIGGCYGSTGPSSIDPSDGNRYATRFPVLSVNDMVRAQHRLIKEQFKIDKLHASMGASMGGMQCLAFASEFPDDVNKIISISGCAKSHPYSIAMRHCQRQVLMSDPNWSRGFYYDSIPPHTGMKLSREIATITYRSGPEWEIRFGTERADPERQPALCPDFLIETYLDHAGEKWCLEYDPNSLLYVSKAMDLFDLGQINRDKSKLGREQAQLKCDGEIIDEKELAFKPNDSSCALPNQKIKENRRTRRLTKEEARLDLFNGLNTFSHKDVLVVGVESDILFPAWQQLEIFDLLKEGSKSKGLNGDNIKHLELSEDVSMFGHDTFLLSLDHFGPPVKEFLEN